MTFLDYLVRETLDGDTSIVERVTPSAYLWREAIGNHEMNLELSAVWDVQMCYDLCQEFMGDNCLLIR